MKQKFLLLIIIASLVGFLGNFIGLSLRQSVIISVFSMSVLGTFFFWDFRISFVFIGSGILFLINAMNMEFFIQYASIDVILFLIGMMIIVAMLKEAGFFMWIITSLLRIKALDGQRLFVMIMLLSFIFAGLMDEVSSILIMMQVVFIICEFLAISPIPLIISSIIATNIGSASTVLGNPIGILIAARAGLTFEDFITHALPVSFIILIITIIILMVFYKDYIAEMSKKLYPHEHDAGFLHLISVPPDRKTVGSIILFTMVLLSIAMHGRMERLLNLEENTLLIIIPVIFAGIVLIYRRDKAIYYVEHEVEWNSLLFFMFLFAQAGVIRAQGIGIFIAEKLIKIVGTNEKLLSGIVLGSTGVLSSVLDNVVVVASYVPVVRGLNNTFNTKPLWWALLFGACYGGNITMIGSTANIVALGLLGKRTGEKITFLNWLKIGLIVGLVSMLIALVSINISSAFK
ncbi:MAG: SLC13 family permease [Endomicrobiia bacterium]